MAGEGWVAAGVSITALQLGVQVGAANGRTDSKPTLHMRQLRLGELSRLSPRRVVATGIALELPFHRPPVEAEFSGQCADRPSMLVEGFQFHRRFSRLHCEVSC